MYGDLAARGDLLGQLGVPVIAELYAWSLIAGVALLMRRGQSRPGVMLAVLVVLFHGDLTMLTESSRNLGPWGTVAVLFWWLNPIVKTIALLWAAQLTASRSTIALPAVLSEPV
ncbi:MAG: hypothetical protein AAGA56_14620 [Myxococcota bacterium]